MAEQDATTVPVWLELYDLKTYSDVEAVTPQGYYVRGMVGGASAFEPVSGILGEAIHNLPENAVPGWIELTTLATHRDMEAVAPIEPYVHGVFDDAGHFYPDEPPSIVGGPVTSE
jgi:hypothetical protein